MSVIYLLHFEQPLAHARHYVGITDNLPERLEQHRKGVTRSARIMQVLAEQGIGFYLARVWKGDRNEERRLKRTGSIPAYCPICCGRVSVEDKRLFSKFDEYDEVLGWHRVIPLDIGAECPF